MRRGFAMFIVIVAIFLLPFVLSGCTDKSVCRELRREEIGPMLMRLTGRELPGKVEDLRAILFAERSFEHLFVAIRTDQKGCEYLLDAFGGQDVQREEFPRDKNNPFSWNMSGFWTGCRFQEKLGVDLFDEELINRIKGDALERANTGHYPKDAVKGYYLAGACSKSVFHLVLLFKDQEIAYLFIANEALRKQFR